MDLMMETLAKKVTPTAAMRSLMAPYRDKLEKSDAARGTLEGRLRRAFDLFDTEMREVWGEGVAQDNGDVPSGPPPSDPAA
jgi:hypothetical protein